MIANANQIRELLLVEMSKRRQQLRPDDCLTAFKLACQLKTHPLSTGEVEHFVRIFGERLLAFLHAEELPTDLESLDYAEFGGITDRCDDVLAAINFRLAKARQSRGTDK